MRGAHELLTQGAAEYLPQPEADRASSSSAIRFKARAMPIRYIDCSACGEDMMQGQLKCQRCGHGISETTDAQLLRAAKRRTQIASASS